MIICENKSKILKELSELRKNRFTIALVPTMGFLHDGHISLIKKAKEVADKVVVTIYVNPTQFGPTEDLDKYPRDFKGDLSLLEKENVDYLFAPKNMYSQNNDIYIEPKAMSNTLCGKNRDGHFRGVCTIVAKFFNIIRPNYAVFGQKDAQQYAILNRMVKDLDYDIDLICAPIIRENDGLAMSSRNKYLSAEERLLAPSLQKCLNFIKKEYKNGRTDFSTIVKEASVFALGNLEYLEAVNIDNLRSVNKLKSDTLVVAAMKLGNTRLIDNTIL